ncbi:hypothetical protein V7166_17995, partial [Bacillus thuringiensis]
IVLANPIVLANLSALDNFVLGALVVNLIYYSTISKRFLVISKMQIDRFKQSICLLEQIIVL